MNQTFVLVSVPVVNNLLAFLKENWRSAINSKNPLMIKISTKSEDYTTAQRRLYWMWCTQFGKQFGYDQDDVHLDMKRRFLINIYYRDDAEYAKTCDAVAVLKESESEQYEIIRQFMIRETSITKASKAQMSEYMDKLYRFAQQQGCQLVTPDDLKWLNSDER